MNPEFTPRWRGECRIHRAAAALIAAAAVLLAGCSGTPGGLASTGPSTHSAPASAAATAATATKSRTVATGFRALDLSFVGDADGWALGTAPCPSRPRHRCAAMRRTTDGGKHWTSATPPAANVPGASDCAVPCVEHVRFATKDIGYAFGPGALFTTADGGAHWIRRPGGADALTIAGSTAIRLVSDHSGCPGPCNLRADIAPVGGSHWTAVSVSARRIDAGEIRLAATTRGMVFLETSQGQAGTLYRVGFYVSSDAGRIWKRRPDPCRAAGAAADGMPMASSQLTVAAADGSLGLLCTSRGDSRAVVITSADGARTFTAGRVVASGRYGIPLGPIAVASAHVLVSATGVAGLGLYQSIDGARSWKRVQQVAGDGDVVPPAFPSATTGHWLAPGGRTIWTTHDAGAHWTPFTFG